MIEIIVIALALMLLVIFTIYAISLVRSFTKKLIINFISGLLFAFILWYFKMANLPIQVLIVASILGIPGIILAIILFKIL